MIFFSNNRPVILCRSVILLLFFTIQSTFGQSVTIPFFDDFSQAKSPNPDSRLWINGGVSINNSFPVNQPTMFVATFDGRSSAGLPYDYVNQLAYGQTDTLTSRPIQLATFQPSDSLYLSFFWEARGLGDLPDDDDTLVVSFRNKRNIWIPVWKQRGNITDNNFRQQLLAIKDTSFLHNNFQFRFETKGRQSGAFDTWHVDYVYLNKNRSQKDITSKDIACRKFTSSYLKRYSAMPLRQYLVNPAAEVNDTLRAEIYNLQEFGNFTPYRWKISDTLSKTIYYDAPAATFGNLAPRVTGVRELKLQPVTNFPLNKAVLKFQFKISTSDAQQPLLPGYDLSVNDSISTYTILDNFYAYDDGTAEIGADFDQNLGKASVQYILSKPDTVGAVRFNFSPYFKDIAGQFFILQILASDKGKPGKMLHQQSIKATYGDGINGFTEYPLDISIAVKDTFYVAWSKINEDGIAIGVDKNTPQFANRIYYNNGSEWIQNTTLKGSLMVRPVMGAKKNANGQPDIVTSTEEPSEQLIVYPNPTTGLLKWNLSYIKYVKIFDMAGREVLSKTVDGQELNIENLPESTYLVNFSDGKKNFLHKIMVVH